MGLEDEKKKGEASGETSEKEIGLSRKNSTSSLSPTEDDDEDDRDDRKPELGPMIALKEQLERDKVFYFIFDLSI